MTPWIRIALRYGFGIWAGREVGEALSYDADLVALIEAALMGVVWPAVGSALTEVWYAIAKRLGWAT